MLEVAQQTDTVTNKKIYIGIYFMFMFFLCCEMLFITPKYTRNTRHILAENSFNLYF